MRKFIKWWKSLKPVYKSCYKFAILLGVVLAVFFIFYDSRRDEDSINRRFYFDMVDKADKVSYPEFKQMLESGAIDTVYYNPGNELMVATKVVTEEKELTVEDCITTYYPSGDDFRGSMLRYSIDLVLITSDTAGTLWLQLFISLFPLILIVIFYGWLMKNQIGGSINAGDVIQKSDVKLSDIVGLDEIMGELNIIISLIKDPAAGAALGAKIPHGILLSGPAGVGKTMIAKAISNAADVPFISMNGSDFVELYVGNGARHVRQLFSVARKNAPCIVFIDEFDAVGSKRDSGQVNSEDTKTINALLKEMDGFKPLEGVFVIAATNFPDKLDKSVTRSGRFDREVAILPPKDWTVREQLFRMYLDGKPLLSDVDIPHIAKTVGGFTGADIAAVCNEASLVALSRGINYISASCIEEAIDRKVFHGSYSKDKEKEPDRRVVAYHEAGHAIVAELLGQKVSRASIRATTSGVGGAVFHEDKDSQFTTKEDLEDRVKVCYAGRISEELQFGKITTGADNDIEQATEVLRRYVCVHGMSNAVGLVNTENLIKEGVYQDTVSFDAIKAISGKLYEETRRLLQDKYYLVRDLAEKLLEVEVMSGDEIKEYLNLKG